MSDCQGCVYYKYESDTNFAYCTKDKQELEVCKDYYPIEDAKADARYGHCDKY